MLYKKELDEQGDYRDAQGNCYSLCFARRIRSEHGLNVGYEEFDSLETALRVWGLREFVPTCGEE